MDAYPVQYVLYLCICATAPAFWYFRGGGGGPAGQPEAFQHNYPIRLSSSSCRRCRIEIPETTPPPPHLSASALSTPGGGRGFSKDRVSRPHQTSCGML